MIRVQLFQPFALWHKDKNKTALLQYDKVRLLVAILCLSPKKQLLRTELIQLLWPELDETKAKARLRHAIHVLRKSINDSRADMVVSTPHLVQLNQTHFQVDVLELLTELNAESAPSQEYAATPAANFLLANVKLPDNETFDLWYKSWVERLHAEIITYRVRYLEQLLDSQQIDQALRYSKKWVHQHPEEENYHRLVIKTLMLIGDNEAALAAYKICTQQLLAHLGTQPSPHTFALLTLETRNHSVLPWKASHRQTLGFRPYATLAMALMWQPTLTVDHHTADHDDTHPEQVLQTIHFWQNQLKAIATRHHGWVNQTGGSTILAHFGYPALHPNPLSLAIQLADSLQQVQLPHGLHLGLAIHADSTLMSDEFGIHLNGLLYQTIVPLAWHAQHLQLLVSPQAAARLASYALTKIQIENKSAYLLDKPSSQKASLSIYGRLSEFEALHQHWHTSQHYDGYITNIYGLPGLGKTRLVHALSKLIHNQGGRTLYLTSSHPEQTPIAVFLEWLLRQKQSKDSFRLSALELDHLYHQLELSQSNSTYLMTEQQLELIKYIVLAYGRENSPILLIWQHFDLANPLVQRCLDQLKLQLSPHLKMLCLLSKQALSLEKKCDATLALSPLKPEALRHYLNQKTKSLKLRSAFKQHLLQKCAGNPFYLDQLLHLHALQLPDQTIPRITDQVHYQLHHLPEISVQLAYLIAALEQAPCHLLTHLLSIPTEQIHDLCKPLVGLGLIQHDNHKNYYCSNGYIQKAIQQAMTRQQKQWLYTQLAQFFIDQNYAADIIAKQFHYARSPEAARWWRQAIAEALGQGSTQKAVSLIAQALISYQYIEDIQLRKKYEFESYMALGSLQISHHGPVAPQTLAAYAQATTLSTADNTPLAVTWGNWVITHSKGQLVEALQYAKKLQEDALQHREPLWYGWSLYAESQFYFWKGNPALAESLLVESSQALEQTSHSPAVHSPLGNHSDALVTSALALAKAAQGDYHSGISYALDAIDRAQRSHSPVSLILCHIQKLRIHYLHQQIENLALDSQLIHQQLTQLAPQSIWLHIVNAYAKLSSIHLKRAPTNLIELEDMVPLINEHLPLGHDAFLCLIAQCAIKSNHTDQAEKRLQQALSIGDERNSVLLKPEIYCLLGDMWLQRQQPEKAKFFWYQAQLLTQQHQLLCYEPWLVQRLKSLS